MSRTAPTALALAVSLALLQAAAAPRSPAPPQHPPIESFPTTAEQLVAAAAFGALTELETLLQAEDADVDAEPDYSTSIALQREIIPPGSPVCSHSQQHPLAAATAAAAAADP